MIDGDGCSSECEFETCYSCSGGSPIGTDSCSILHIEPTLSAISSSNDFEVYFSEAMNQTEITNDDFVLEIESSYSISYSWVAEYIDDTTLSVDISTTGVFEGGEKLTVKFINYKVFRTSIGG